MPYLSTLSKFRDSVRKLAMAGASAQELLALTDSFRDVECVDLGIALDDQEGEAKRFQKSSKTDYFVVDGQALVKLVAPATLIRIRDEKIAAALEKSNRKAAQAAAEEVKRLEKLAKGKLSPSEMFKVDAEYTAWDAEGLPTHDKEGVEVAKSKLKKLKKEFDVQGKLHSAWLASNK